MIPYFIVSVISIGLTFLSEGTAHAQSYPTKPVRIVTSEAGGGTDVITRVVAQGLTGVLGQQVIVDNRGAAGGAIGAELVARAPPDGYTLLFQGSNIWLLPFLRSNVPYDPLKDFSPITLVTSSPNILLVHPSVEAASVKDLIALARAKPGWLNYATGLVGGSTHLAPALFKAMANVDIVQVTYKGGAAALNDLIAGRVQIMFPSMGSGIPHVKSGKLKALAVTTAQPSVLFPGLPTIAASGLPGYEFINVTGMFATAKTPVTIINRLNQEIVRIVNQPDVRARFMSAGNEVVGSSPQEFASAVKADMIRMGKVIKDAGIRDDG